MRQLLSYYILIIFIGAGLVNGGAIVEIITKTADVHDAGCDCGLEIAILTPKVLSKNFIDNFLKMEWLMKNATNTI